MTPKEKDYVVCQLQGFLGKKARVTVGGNVGHKARGRRDRMELSPGSKRKPCRVSVLLPGERWCQHCWPLRGTTESSPQASWPLVLPQQQQSEFAWLCHRQRKNTAGLMLQKSAAGGSCILGLCGQLSKSIPLAGILTDSLWLLFLYSLPTTAWQKACLLILKLTLILSQKGLLVWIILAEQGQRRG